MSSKVYASKDVRVFIAHGYNATATSHWFPWLKKQVEQSGAKVHIFNFPNSKIPKIEPWKQLIKNEIQNPNKNTFLIGHSLGCITLLKYVSELPVQTKIGGLICVSGFAELLPKIPILNEFTEVKYDVEKVKKIVLKRIVIVSENDTIVPPEATKQLAKDLEATLISDVNGGHFLESDGYAEFPEALKQLKKLIK